MRIGELARRAEISRDTIRFYERHGLIHSTVDPNADNSYRIYPEDVLLTLDVIKDAQAAGLSIAQITVFIGQFMALSDDSDTQAFLDARIEEVADRIKASQRFLNMLKQTRSALERAPQDGVDEVRSNPDKTPSHE